MDFTEHVMMALLPVSPTDFTKVETPHMTLVYAGKKDELPPTAFNELAKDAASLAMMNTPLTLRVKGLDVFGDGTAESPSVDVLKLEPNSELLAMRRFVESWNESEHPFTPHITIGPQGQFLQDPPRLVVFDRITVGWGKEYLTFWLKKRY